MEKILLESFKRYQVEVIDEPKIVVITKNFHKLKTMADKMEQCDAAMFRNIIALNKYYTYITEEEFKKFQHSKIYVNSLIQSNILSDEWQWLA